MQADAQLSQPPVDFEQYLYAKKTVVDFQRELKLLHVRLGCACGGCARVWAGWRLQLFPDAWYAAQEFARLNSEGVRKIVKKFDKRVGYVIAGCLVCVLTLHSVALPGWHVPSSYLSGYSTSAPRTGSPVETTRLDGPPDQGQGGVGGGDFGPAQDGTLRGAQGKTSGRGGTGEWIKLPA